MVRVSRIGKLSLLGGLALSLVGIIPNVAPGQGSGITAGPLKGVKCIVDGVRSCDTKYSVSYLGGAVYFSSQEAAGKFQHRLNESRKTGRQPVALLTRANHQLALTGQARQIACPMTGKPADPNHMLSIAGVTLHFHSATAQQRLETMEHLIERASYVFHPDRFSAVFQLPLTTTKPTESPRFDWIDTPQRTQFNSIATRPGIRCQR